MHVKEYLILTASARGFALDFGATLFNAAILGYSIVTFNVPLLCISSVTTVLASNLMIEDMSMG